MPFLSCLQSMLPLQVEQPVKAPKGGPRKGPQLPEQSHVQQINALVAEYVAMKTQLEEQHARYAHT